MIQVRRIASLFKHYLMTSSTADRVVMVLCALLLLFCVCFLTVKELKSHVEAKFARVEPDPARTCPF